MLTIDSDAHVIENMATWRFLEESEQAFMPSIVQRTAGNEARNVAGNIKRNYWVVNRRIHDKDENLAHDVPEESREMRDVQARIAHMDELEIDIQVLFPTLMLRPIADRAPLEFALCRSYNRWLAEIWKQGNGRLRWVAAPPIMSLDKARAEMEFAKENGACGIFMRGLENERALSDPYFYPLYEIAGDLDLPISIHLGNGSYTIHDFYDHDTTFSKFKLPTIAAFHSLIMHETPTRFPKVRWAIIEASANWLPFILHDLRQRFDRRGKELPDDVLGENNIYVTCEVMDDLPHVLAAAGSDNIVIGTDYGHSDSATEIEALRLLRDKEGVGPEVVKKILSHNPARLYGLA
ncbi:MAG: amidohydrolase family protein [Alphaproteobacteria bacterium]|nr:amidohydrolase family protein [Alphaproteobacteria bacterium]